MNAHRSTDEDRIRTRPCVRCPVCGSPGVVFYRDLKDAFFGVPGSWSSRKCSNPKCRLVWLDPMPVKEDSPKAYRNYFTHHGSASARWIEKAEQSGDAGQRLYRLVKKGYHRNRYGYHRGAVEGWKRAIGYLAYIHPGWRATLDSGILYLPAVPGGRLLEIGSGGGQQLKIMHDLGWDAQGVDLDPDAKKNAESKGMKVSLGELEEQHFPDNYFDAVISNHVIEHVYEPESLMREVHRILKPSGRLVFITPNIESWGQRVFKNADLMFMDSPRHLYVFAAPSLRQLAVRSGFKKAKVLTTIRHASSLYLSDRAISRTGHYEAGEHIPFKDRLGAKGLQIMEWSALKLNPAAGEEIILIGEKGLGQ